MSASASPTAARGNRVGLRAGATLLAGVDEAGLGPLLGPLSIGYAVMAVPEPDADPWKLLRKVVTKRLPRGKKPRGPRGGRLVVADSKVVFSRNPKGFRRLERTALSFMALLREDGRAPRDARELVLGDLRPEPGLVGRHPWYEELPALPVELDPDALELGTALLARELSARGLSLLDAGVRIVPAGELNDSYAETDNKGATLWQRSLEVLRHLWVLYGETDPRVVVDILGGRIRYGPLLARGFPDASVRLVHEGTGHSSYVLEERSESTGESWLPRRMRLEFLARGEEASFQVALASCLAKYARELVMTGFNGYFAARQPGLRPTAGYTTDGRRWLEEAGTALSAAALDEDVLVRRR